MTEDQKKCLMAILFKAVTDYYEMSMHVLQKNVLNNKRPQQWMVDQAFQNVTQNTTQFSAMASNPVPTTSGPGNQIADILKLLGRGSPANTNETTADTPANTIVVNGQTYQVIDTPE